MWNPEATAGVGVGGDDVAGLASAGQGDQQGQLGDLEPAADLDGDGCHDQDGHGDEDSDGADDHGGQGQGEDGHALAQAVHYGSGYPVGGAGLHHDPRQHAGSQDPDDRAHDALGAGHHDVDGLAQGGAPDQAAYDGSQHERISGVELLENEDDGQGQTQQSGPP